MNSLTQFLPSELVNYIKEYAINEPQLRRMWLARYKSIVSELDKGYRWVGIDSDGRHCVKCYSKICDIDYCMAGNNCEYVLIDFVEFQKSVSKLIGSWEGFRHNRRGSQYFMDPISVLHIKICASNGYQFYSESCKSDYNENYNNLIQEFNQGPQSWRGYGNNFQKIWNLWFNSYCE